MRAIRRIVSWASGGKRSTRTDGIRSPGGGVAMARPPGIGAEVGPATGERLGVTVGRACGVEAAMAVAVATGAVVAALVAIVAAARVAGVGVGGLAHPALPDTSTISARASKNRSGNHRIICTSRRTTL